MAARVAVLDANVLYGIEVTDLVLTMATRRLYRPHWSPEILDEVARNLRLRKDLDPSAIERRIAHMNRALPGALEAPPTALVDEMPVNDKDRHVLALAVHAGAPVIVTENLRDFPPRLLRPHEVEAVSADT
ncbi:MAG: PIN domain-containing protein, partial [Acidimicrobiales bacterium]